MMKRRELERSLLTLETTPILLGRLLSEIPSPGRPDPANPSFARLLHGFALREEELWSRWIDLLLAGRSPLLPELKNRAPESLAGMGPLDTLGRFQKARSRNLRLLREAPGAAWNCAGILEPGGILYLRELPAAMADGDRKDLEEAIRTKMLLEPESRDAFAEPRARSSFSLFAQLAHRG